jgi:PHD/YefM family antitoxin component YafN of YafNO toxin-antitoxin module
MKVYTYSQARKNLKALLDEVQEQGQVALKRRNGQRFLITPDKSTRSPLDIEGVDTNITLEEINAAVRESRRC